MQFDILKTLKSITLVCALTGLSACGTNDNGSSELSGSINEKRKGRNPILVVLSGWNSCKKGSNDVNDPMGSKMWEPAQNYRQEIKSLYGKAPTWIVMCYTYYKQTVSGRGRYLSDENTAEYKRASPLEMIDVIKEKVRNTENADLYLIGYSFGGWLAMKTADAIGGSVNIPMFATLDPISQQNCNMTRWITSWIDTKHRGCREFPKDLTQNTLNFIKKHTNTWRHYFQTDYDHVHSGSVTQADTERMVKTEFDDHSAHSVVGFSSEIWADFTDVLNQRTPPDSPFIVHEAY